MYYRHDLAYEYPDRCDQHMIDVPHQRDVVLDEHYPYQQKSFWFKCQRVFYWIMVHGIIRWLLCITHGLRIHGKQQLRQHKAALKNGAITISNHVFKWDFLCVLKVIFPHLVYFPAWKTNLEGPDGPLIRMSGGIPIPDGDWKAMKAFKAAMEEVLESKKWMHFYPEGSMWYYYPDVRPFKKAVFRYAVQYDRPIIPMGFSFRPRKGITRLFTDKPAVDLHIGQPLYPDKTLSPAEATRQLQAQAYQVVQELCGIGPEHPAYRVDQDPAHYQKTM